jgi:hypothetical protein
MPFFIGSSFALNKLALDFFESSALSLISESILDISGITYALW